MAQPDRDELAAALLAAQPKSYRERRPEQALQRAQQLARTALANWPRPPVRPTVVQGALTVLTRDGAYDPVELATGTHHLEIEGAGVRLQASYLRSEDGLGALQLRIDPLGVDWLVRMAVDDFSVNPHQASLLVQGRREDPTRLSG